MNLSDVGPLTFQHLYLVIVGTLIGGGTGFLLAIWVRRRPRWAASFMGLAEVIQTLPGIALLAFLLLAFGLGNGPVIVALALYAILPVLAPSAASRRRRSLRRSAADAVPMSICIAGWAGSMPSP